MAGFAYSGYTRGKIFELKFTNRFFSGGSAAAHQAAHEYKYV
jgi:hypothetical protein